MQNYLNIVISSKGGVGKTTIASYLFEYLNYHKEQPTTFIDSDLSNQDLKQTTFYEPVKIDLKDVDGKTISPSKIEDLLLTFGGSNLVIDVGANSYLAWYSYLRDNYEELSLFGAKVILHVIICGGALLNETITCLKELCDLGLDCPIVVYLNNGFDENDNSIISDPIEFRNSKDNASFADKLDYIVTLPTCRLFFRRLYDKVKKNHLALTQLATATYADEAKLLPLFINDKDLALYKHRAIKYRETIFESLKTLDPLYDIE